MFLLIYNIIIRLYGVAAKVAAWWNPKARRWVSGRKQLFQRVESAMKAETRPVVWMHSASLGEFEQGQYLLEKIRLAHPGVCLVVTFFSPSGYEAKKNYRGADHIFYLPLPTRAGAGMFIDLIRPKLVLWIKYDYWYHYLVALRERRIPVLLISAIFHLRQPFFRWYGSLYRRMLQSFTWLFVQTPESAQRLAAIGVAANVSVNGDTRFDRVIDIAAQTTALPLIDSFCGDAAVIVAGSTWPEDEEELAHYANTRPALRFIIAPHEVDEPHLTDIERLFRRSVRYSMLPVRGVSEANTLIIDNIGMLSTLYRYATIAYVGGGFGSDGVHNVLEAAVYGKPVVFGPVFNKFREAIDLLEEGGAFTVETALELESRLDELLERGQLYDESSRAARSYVYDHRGATDNILRYIQENRLLIS